MSQDHKSPRVSTVPSHNGLGHDHSPMYGSRRTLIVARGCRLVNEASREKVGDRGEIVGRVEMGETAGKKYSKSCIPV